MRVRYIRPAAVRPARSRPAVLALGMLAGAALVPPAAADSRTVLGEWVGTYTCAQGLTGLTLTLSEATPGSAQALFHFYADPGNPGVPTGCFTLDGGYEPASGRLTLKGGRWLLRPAGYHVVSFEGRVDAEGRHFEGVVKGPSGCTSFALARTPSPAAPQAQCALPDAPTTRPARASAGVIAETLAGDGRIDLDILFDFAEASIRPDSVPQLDELGRILMSPSLLPRRIGIQGHTDAVGSADANRSLSLRRAQAVLGHLVQRFGAEPARFDVRGYGEDRLKQPDRPDDAANRRVEILLLEEKGG
jgi:outer membrane protein OmpA-like peptidoglycan-associated protein